MNKLKEIRELNQLSMYRLSKLSGTSTREISYIEKGLRIPNVLLAMRIADALNVSVTDIFFTDQELCGQG